MVSKEKVDPAQQQPDPASGHDREAAGDESVEHDAAGVGAGAAGGEVEQERDAAGDSAAAADDPEALARRLQEAEDKAQEYWDQLLRVRAEFENIRKRSERDVESARRYALEKFVEELLPVRDSLDLGLQAAQDDNADVAKLREGTELTLKMLTSVMEKFGVAEVNPEGERFDPELHEAMSTQPTSSVEPNTVTAVYQKGYSLNGRLIRPALVIVASAPQEQEEARDEAASGRDGQGGNGENGDSA